MRINKFMYQIINRNNRIVINKFSVFPLSDGFFYNSPSNNLPPTASSSIAGAIMIKFLQNISILPPNNFFITILYLFFNTFLSTNSLNTSTSFLRCFPFSGQTTVMCLVNACKNDGPTTTKIPSPLQPLVYEN